MRSHSGPTVARAFQLAAAAVMACAWVSLGMQVRVLIGEHGLLPARATLAAIEAAGVPFWEAPVLFAPDVLDASLQAGVLVGLLLTVLGGLGIASRAAFFGSGLLYLGYTVIGGDFLAFQWDNLLVETCALLCWLPRDRAAPLAHLAFRLLLFKLYFESGVAKWQSHLGDWHDGSAMTFYYETAPLPARLAPYAHHLPEAFHRLESWGALVMELPVPFLIFGPRRARLLAFGVLTAFQVVNTLTANYGFFTYMACALHLFLLDDSDLLATRRGFARIAPAVRRARFPAVPVPAFVRGAGAWLVFGVYAGLSVALFCTQFARATALGRAAVPIAHAVAPLRVVNTYHLFGHITRERIEPEFQVRVAGRWQARDLRYKPGDPTRPLPYVAPHQPRVDFRLWFYGLSFRRGMPLYVQALLDRLCHAPHQVQPLFASPLPGKPDAVRIAFHRYRFTDASTLARTHQTWHRERLGETTPRMCEP